MPSQAIAMSDIPAPLTWEAVVHAKHSLSIVIGLNHRVFLKNGSEKEQSLASGTVIAGWFAGKFWHHRGDDAGHQAKKRKKEEAITEVTEADVLYQLDGAGSEVSYNGKVVKLADIMAEKRKSMPDVGVQYHKVIDKPVPGNPGWFELELLHSIYFRTEDVPTKAGEDGATPKIALHHLAGCMKWTHWATPSSHVVWAVKWSPTAAKGLTCVRPMVVTKRAIIIPARSAIELTAKPATAESAAD